MQNVKMFVSGEVSSPVATQVETLNSEITQWLAANPGAEISSITMLSHQGQIVATVIFTTA